VAATWVVGDVHGCAEELAALIEALGLGAGVEMIAVGDLFHRGPDPVGVYERLRALPRFRTVLGNHELALLRRLDAEAAGAPPAAEALRGDGGAAVAPSFAPRAAEIAAWLRGAPAFLRGEGALDGRGWLVVHGSLIPGRRPEDTPAAQLAGWHRLGRGEDAPSWVAAWRGPELALFGHRRSACGPHRDERGRLVAYGLDTGCVYGGALTALRLADGEVRAVPALRAWA
jgi:hypothetical protein